MILNNLYKYTKLIAIFVVLLITVTSGQTVFAQTKEAGHSALQAQEQTSQLQLSEKSTLQQALKNIQNPALNNTQPGIQQPVIHAQIPVSVEVKVEPKTPIAGKNAFIKLMLKSSFPDIRVISTPELEPEGAAVISVGASTRTTADVKGQKSFVKEFSFKVVVKRSGKILVPSITVEYEQNKAKGTLTTPAISFNALEPPRPVISMQTLLSIGVVLFVIIILLIIYKRVTSSKALKREKIENETKDQLDYEKSLNDRLSEADKFMSSGDTKSAFDCCAQTFDILFKRNCGFSFELNKKSNTEHNIKGLQLDLNTQQDLFRLIEAFYNARYAGLSQASDETAAIVKDSRRMVKKLKQSFSGSFKCPECGCLVSKNSDLCPDCGAQFEKVKNK